MIEFSEVALKIISDYKLLLRKIYYVEEAALKIKELKLKRSQIKRNDNIFLYNVVKGIHNHLERYVVDKGKSSPSYFFGADELLQYTTNFMSNYQIVEDKLLHVSREASRAVIEVIQIVALPEHKLTKEIYKRLFKCVGFVSKFGKIEHITLLNDAMNQNKQAVNYLMTQYSDKKTLEDFI